MENDSSGGFAVADVETRESKEMAALTADDVEAVDACTEAKRAEAVASAAQTVFPFGNALFR